MEFRQAAAEAIILGKIRYLSGFIKEILKKIPTHVHAGRVVGKLKTETGLQAQCDFFTAAHYANVNVHAKR